MNAKNINLLIQILYENKIIYHDNAASSTNVWMQQGI